jgi:hypothetical protein
MCEGYAFQINLINFFMHDFDINKFYDDLSKSWDKTRPEYTTEIFRKILFLQIKNEKDKY